jgi:hypothetical protein
MKEYLNGHTIAHPTEVFDPDAIRILTPAFDYAWQRLQNSGVRFDSDHQSEQARNTLAKCIIEQAGGANVTSGVYALVPSFNTPGQI